MTTQSTTTKEALEPGAGGHVHRFNAVRVPPEFGHSYLRCAYCGLSKHLESHNASTCDICSRVSAPIVAPVVDQQPHCWHCGVVLESAELKLRCDQCPSDCDDELCNAFGCSPQDAAPASTAALPDKAEQCRCGKCGHSDGVDANGWCLHNQPYDHNPATSLCGCKCEFKPATTPPSTLAKAAAEEIVGTVFDNTAASPETLKQASIERIEQYLTERCFCAGKGELRRNPRVNGLLVALRKVRDNAPTLEAAKSIATISIEEYVDAGESVDQKSTPTGLRSSPL